MRLNFAPHPDLRIQKLAIGRELAPLLVIDNLMSHPDALVEHAAGKFFGDVTSYYPGVRSKAPLTYQQFLLGHMRGVFGEYFRLAARHHSIHGVSLLGGDHFGRQALAPAMHSAH